MRFMTPVSVREFRGPTEIERGCPAVIARPITPPSWHQQPHQLPHQQQQQKFQQVACWSRPVTPIPSNKNSRHRQGERPPSTQTSRSFQPSPSKPSTTTFSQVSRGLVNPITPIPTPKYDNTKYPPFQAQRPPLPIPEVCESTPSTVPSSTPTTRSPKVVRPSTLPSTTNQQPPTSTKSVVVARRPACVPLEKFRLAVSTIAAQAPRMMSSRSDGPNRSATETSSSDGSTTSTIVESAPDQLLRVFAERRLREKAIEWKAAHKRLRCLKSDVRNAQNRLKESREEYASTMSSIESISNTKETLKVRVADLQKCLLSFDAARLPPTATGIQLKQAVVSLQNANHCKTESERLEDLGFEKEQKLRNVKRDILSQKRNIRGDTEQLVLRHRAVEARMSSRDTRGSGQIDRGVSHDVVEGLIEEIEFLSIAAQSHRRTLATS